MFFSLEHLPAEIMLSILNRIGDIYTLDNLLRASPNAFRVFEMEAVAITEAALIRDSNYCETKDIIRLVVLIRTGGFPITSLGELQERVTTVALVPKRNRYGLKAPFKPSNFPRTSTAIMLSVLATSRRLLRSTWELLHTFLERFRALKPYTGIIPHDWEGGDRDRPLSDTLRILDSSSVPIVVHDIGAPTWTEEQLVLRGYWSIQLIYDLRRAVDHKIGPIWSDMEAFKLLNFSIAEIYDFRDVVEANKLCNAGAGGCVIYDPSETVGQSAMLSILDYMTEGDCGHELPKEFFRNPAPEWGTLWEEEEFFDSDVNWTIDDYAQVFFEDDCSEVIPFDVYRRLGMAIWTYERLKGYGLHDKDPIAWLSILGPEDKVKVKEVAGRGFGPDWSDTPQKVRFTFEGEEMQHVNPLIKSYMARLGVTLR